MIAIIDYDAGNLQSVKKALDYLGCENAVTSDSGIISEADGIILPGVGAFGDAVKSLKDRGLHKTLTKEITNGKPFLGICLGMQLLFEGSDESKGVSGLGLLGGKIQRIPDRDVKVPHIGWNSLEIKQDGGIFKGINDGAFVYFVHSYYLTAERESDVSARTFYSVPIDAAVSVNNINAVQFHPEKSGDVGLSMLRNFVMLTGGDKNAR